jgi:hypothetical protein
MNANDKKSSEASKFLNNLESFLTESDPTGEELAEGLRDGGLDPDRLDGAFRDLLKQHAPTWRQQAERGRKSALEALSKGREKISRTRAEIEQRIRSTIQAMQQLGAPDTAGAYHRKFQKATDADLESLLEDLEAQYEAMKGKKNNE